MLLDGGDQQVHGFGAQLLRHDRHFGDGEARRLAFEIRAARQDRNVLRNRHARVVQRHQHLAEDACVRLVDDGGRAVGVREDGADEVLRVEAVRFVMLGFDDRHAELLRVRQQAFAEDDDVTGMAVVVGFVVAQEHDGAVSLLVQEVDGLAAHQREIDVHAGAAGVRRRIADSHARLGKSAGLSGALVILLHVEQYDAIRKIALRHAADILHCIRTGT